LDIEYVKTLTAIPKEDLVKVNVSRDLRNMVYNGMKLGNVGEDGTKLLRFSCNQGCQNRCTMAIHVSKLAEPGQNIGILATLEHNHRMPTDLEYDPIDGQCILFKQLVDALKLLEFTLGGKNGNFNLEKLFEGKINKKWIANQVTLIRMKLYFRRNESKTQQIFSTNMATCVSLQLNCSKMRKITLALSTPTSTPSLEETAHGNSKSATRTTLAKEIQQPLSEPWVNESDGIMSSRTTVTGDSKERHFSPISHMQWLFISKNISIGYLVKTQMATSNSRTPIRHSDFQKSHLAYLKKTSWLLLFYFSLVLFTTRLICTMSICDRT